MIYCGWWYKVHCNWTHLIRWNEMIPQTLKVHGPIFKIKFCISFEESSHQRFKFKYSIIELVKPFGCGKQFCTLQLPYCLYNHYVNFIMVTITRHIFINIFQTHHFSAVKFYMGYEKNMTLFCDTKISKKWQKVEK